MTEQVARPINPAALKWFEARGIEPETVLHYEIYTARLAPFTDGKFGEPIPDAQGKVIAFPYLQHGREINAKFRWQHRAEDGTFQRRFMQRPGSRKTFWNADVLDDPALEKGDQALVIVEGEVDALSVIQAGYPWVVSVPDGAVADRDEMGRPIPMRPDHEIDPANDPKFEFIANNWERLKKVKRIVLFTDGDGPGQRLRDELARRLDRVRCYWVQMPDQDVLCVKDCDSLGEEIHRPVKDANEILVHLGAEVVLDCIEKAKPIAIPGLYSLDDFMEETRVTYKTGFDLLDEFMLFYGGCFRVVTGLAGSGKSTFMTQLLFNAAEKHGRKSVIASFEAPIKPDMQRMLRAMFIKKPLYETLQSGQKTLNWSKKDMDDADEFIRSHFCFVTRDPSGRGAQVCNLAWVIERFEDAVVRFGVNHALLDPWNKVDHVREYGERSDEYLLRSLNQVIDFASRTKVDTTIATHPNADAGRKVEAGEPMSLYQIQEGSHWPNAAEQGVVVHRASKKDSLVRILVKKVKFRGTGTEGSCYVHFDEAEERFTGAFADGKGVV